MRHENSDAEAKKNKNIQKISKASNYSQLFWQGPKLLKGLLCIQNWYTLPKIKLKAYNWNKWWPKHEKKPYIKEISKDFEDKKIKKRYRRPNTLQKDKKNIFFCMNSRNYSLRFIEMKAIKIYQYFVSCF